jgi:MSHA biogenesis protein MshP
MTLVAADTQCTDRARAAGRIGAAKRPRGFALIPALFLIVVLGALAVVAVRVGNSQQQAVIMSLEEARALAAAQAGIEWGAYESLHGICPTAAVLNLVEASLNEFTVVVTCAATPIAIVPPIGNAYSYVLKSTASIGTYGQPGFVRRVVSGTYTNAT